MIKFFYPDKNGKISFTVEELEKLLTEVYEAGRDENRDYRPYITWTSPYGTSSDWYITTSSNGTTNLHGEPLKTTLTDINTVTTTSYDDESGDYSISINSVPKKEKKYRMH